MISSVTLLYLASFLTGLAAAAPCPSPADGYPAPNATQLLAISKIADGKLGNAPPPAKLSDSTLTAFQALAFGEAVEVAFFSSLLKNVTGGVTGYDRYLNFERKDLAEILRTVIAAS